MLGWFKGGWFCLCKWLLVFLLALTGSALAQTDFEQPELREFQVQPREIIRGTPLKGFDIQGHGDGAARHFSYLVKVTRGVLTLQLQARAKTGATALSVRLEDAEGAPVSKVEALAGTENEVMQVATYQADRPQTLRVHVNIDPNCGPYILTLTGPIER